jgi:hypothetical protein
MGVVLVTLYCCSPDLAVIMILVGASAICWAIWLTRNDIIFDKVLVRILLAASIQGNLLDQVLVHVTDGGGSTFDEDWMQYH